MNNRNGCGIKEQRPGQPMRSGVTHDMRKTRRVETKSVEEG